MKDTFDLQNKWRRPGYVFPREKYIPRMLFDRLLADLDAAEVTVVVGSRQVGKTFLIKMLIEQLLSVQQCDPAQIFYFNFDAFNLIDLISNDRDFLDFIKYYGKTGKRSYIFLDEAQRVPEIGLIVKRYYDLGLNAKFVISGSSSLEIKSQVKESLTGRKHLFELYPVSFAEFVSFKGVDLPSDYEKIIRFESAAFQRYFNEFVIFGGYPGVVKVKPAEDKALLLKEIFNSYVQKDISDFLKIEDIAGFNRLVHFLAYQQTGLCKVSEIAKNTRLSRHYVEKYLFSLEETYVVSLLRPYFVNFGKAVIKAPKLYFCDTGLRNAVFGQFEWLDNRRDSGALVENFVFCELLKNTEKDRLWFYRTTRGSEIDFLFVKGDAILPIEVKYGFNRQKTVPKTITFLSQRADIKKAVIVTRDYHHEETRNGLKIFFRPCWTAFNLSSLFKEL